MKLAPILLIPLLFLSSCTIDWNDEKDKKIAELEKQIQDDTFKKKQECGKFLIQLSKLDSREIIYSRESNTCYVIFIVKEDNGNQIYKIADLYSFNIPYSIGINSSGAVMNYQGFENISTGTGNQKEEAQCAFNEVVRKLKGTNYPDTGNYFSIDCKK